MTDVASLASVLMEKGGETGCLIATRDWSASPLGPVDTWPGSLRTTLSLILLSPTPMVLLWGSDGIMLYNDAYSVFAGGRHPALLGARVREGWPEVAEFNDNVMRVGLTGGTLAYRDQELTLYRHGRPEPVWMNLDYSPVLDESGRPSGVVAIVVETTERVLAERRLASEHDRLLQTFEQTPGFIMSLEGPHHAVRFVNAAHRRLFGSRDWVGRRLREMLPGEAAGSLLAPLDRVYETGERFKADALAVRLRQNDGSLCEHRLSLVYEAIRGPDSQVRGVLCEGSDVTAAYRAQEALALSEERLRAAVSIDTVGAIFFDEAGRIFDANAAFLRMSGLSRTDIELGRITWQSLTAPQWQDCSERAFVELQERGESTPHEREYQRRDGSRWWALFAGRRFADGTGVEFVLDITERKQIEAALREETRLLETLNRVGAAMAGELALEPLVQMITDAGVALTGARFGSYFHNTMDETGERLHLFTLSGAQREQFVRLGRPRMTGVFGPTFRNEGVIRSDDILCDPRYGRNPPHRGMPHGHLPVRSYLAIPVVSRAGSVLGGLLFGHPEPGRFTSRHERLMQALASQAAIAIDNARLFQEAQGANAMLEQRVAERTAELTEAQDALHQAQKMEAIGQLTGGIAHDFNNLLTAISGSLEIIDKRLLQDRPRGLGRFIAAAQASAQRAASLTQRLLAFSRRQTLAPKPTDVNRLVFGMEDLIRRTVGPGIRLEVTGADGLWLARIDPVQLESALLNLAINSRDAMPDGGRLMVETANCALADAAARSLRLPPGEYLSISVTDTGSGIATEVIDRIFDPFFTTKPIGQGTGLGLSMIHGFLRQSGGAVRVRSEVGAGTRMSLYLPRFAGTLQDEEVAMIQTEDNGEASGTGRTVLVVDDEAMVRMLIIDVLEEAGYLALSAEEGASGLRILQSDARIDLLVTDVGLPGGMNGRQLAGAARAARPRLKVLFITGFAETSVLDEGRLEPGMDVLPKPFSLAGLASKIAEMIKSETPA